MLTGPAPKDPSTQIAGPGRSARTHHWRHSIRTVAATMPGPPRARRDILAELRSGLLDAVDTHRSAGLTAGAATQAAITEFGDTL